MPMLSLRRILPIGILLLAVFAVSFYFYSRDSGSDGREIVLALPIEPSSLDPRSNPSAAIAQVALYNIYETLVKVDANGKIIPSLAKSWDHNGLIWDFYLEPRIFHNGIKFTSGDVVWTFSDNRGGNPRREFFENMEKVEAITPYHVRITLGEHRNEFLHSLSTASAVIVEKTSAGRNKSKPVGTGPYMFVNWKPGEAIILEKSPYFDSDLVFNRVIQRFYKDDAPLVAAVRSGEVDYAPYVNPEHISFFQDSDDFTLSEGKTYGEVIVALNNRNPVLGNPEVRRAMQMALDRESIMKVAMWGYGSTIGSHYTSLQDFYLDTNEVYRYDLAKAKAIMNRLGKKEIKLNMLIPDLSYARKSSQMVAEMLSKIGIEVSIRVLDWPRWIKEVYTEKKYDMTIIAHIEFMDILNYGRPDYYWGYDDESFRQLARKIKKERNPSKYGAYLREAQMKIAKDVPNLFLFELPRLSVSKKGIEGLPLNDPVFAVEVANLSMHR